MKYDRLITDFSRMNRLLEVNMQIIQELDKKVYALGRRR
jgi:hypothetical protein